MEFDLDSHGDDAWLLDAMSTSLHFSAVSPPVLPPWPCGDPHHPSMWLDTAALQDDGPSVPAEKSEIAKKCEHINGKCQVHLPLVDDCSDSSYFLKEKLTVALMYFKESTNQHLLVQVWLPIRKGDHYMLSTSGQPFVLDEQSIGLLEYRAVSMMYTFAVDGDSVEELGLPGRVYKQRLPEWTPDVQYYSSIEYARLNHAISYNVHGTVALPVFDSSMKSCIAVVELITTSKKVNYAREVGEVSKALEAVNLKSTEVIEHPHVQIFNEGHKNVLVEMLEIITVICEELKLPIAQTWVPWKYQNLLIHCGGEKKSCFDIHGSCAQELCMSTSAVVFHIIDAHMWGFRDACVEHHLKKGQGVSGKAFILRRPCFSKDVTRFSKMEYPLVHYARMFGLAGCFSICLQSAYNRNEDYVLEFFLPPDCRENGEQMVLLDSILALLRQYLNRLQVATDEGSNEVYLQVDAITIIDNGDIQNAHVQRMNCEGGIHESDSQKRIAPTESETYPSPDNTKCNGKLFARQNGGCSSDSLLLENNSKHNGRRRGKEEKTFSLEVIQQYFTGSLKNAAKSLGVCPTTMKRICRQHGISRWPSRQISKVNRTVSKLKKKSFLANINRQIEAEKASNSRGSSKDSSTQSGRSEESYLVSPANRTFVSTLLEPQQNMYIQDGFTKESFQKEDTRFHGMFVNGSRSLKDCKNHTTSAVNGTILGHSGSLMTAQNSGILTCPGSLMTAQNSGIVTVKARYKEDLLRFRFPCSGSFITLKDEVAKRIQMDGVLFDIKYLDDDHEWVKLTCDTDLEECMEISRTSGSNVLRLLVTDIAPVLGSSCGSTG